jgi:hypothetical protein
VDELTDVTSVIFWKKSIFYVRNYKGARIILVEPKPLRDAVFNNLNHTEEA